MGCTPNPTSIECYSKRKQMFVIGSLKVAVPTYVNDGFWISRNGSSLKYSQLVYVS